MNTSEDFMEEEFGGGYEIHNIYLISMSHFDLIELPIKIIYSPLLINFQYFIILVWTWISLEMKSS